MVKHGKLQENIVMLRNKKYVLEFDSLSYHEILGILINV